MTAEQIQATGFKSVGKDVLISTLSAFYNPGNIILGDHCRIDDFCVISAGDEVTIGRYVHLSTHCSILGSAKVYLGDYSGLSAKVTIFSSTDSYDGLHMTNPCVPKECRNTVHSSVYLCDHVVIGPGSVVLPGVFMARGCAVGAMSLVKGEQLEESMILCGIPAKVIKERGKRIFELEKLLNDDGINTLQGQGA